MRINYDSRPSKKIGGGARPVDFLSYASISATGLGKKNKDAFNLLDAFPSSPDCSPIKGGGDDQQSPRPSMAESYGAFPSKRRPLSNLSLNSSSKLNAISPFKRSDLKRLISKTPKESSIVAPTIKVNTKSWRNNEHRVVDGKTPSPYTKKSNNGFLSTVTEEKNGGEDTWVGIGFGQSMALSVCSESPETPMIQQPTRDKHIPRSIMFSPVVDKLPPLEENRTSSIPVHKTTISRKARYVAKKVLLDVEELSVDLSVMGDIDSIASAMTKESCVDLAYRLEKMERQLLDLAGQTSKADALRALAKATNAQSKRAGALEKKVRKQEKKISTLNDMCERFMESKCKSKEGQTKMKMEIDELKEVNDGLTVAFHASETKNEDLEVQLRSAEAENVEKSRLLLNSYSNANNEIQSKYDKLKVESERRAEEDNAMIQKLETKIERMTTNHASWEKRSEKKIQILMQIKNALEEQIRLLEEGDDDISV